MKYFNLTKDSFTKSYNDAIDEYLDICDWVTHIDGKNVCGFTYGILTKFDIDKPLPIENFYELYLSKYSEKTLDLNIKSLNTQETIDVVYDLLTELFDR